MSILATALIAPAATGGISNIPTSLVVIVVIVAVLGVIGAIGYRSPDRPPHADEQHQREEEE